MEFRRCDKHIQTVRFWSSSAEASPDTHTAHRSVHGEQHELPFHPLCRSSPVRQRNNSSRQADPVFLDISPIAFRLSF